MAQRFEKHTKTPSFLIAVLIDTSVAWYSGNGWDQNTFPLLLSLTDEKSSIEKRSYNRVNTSVAYSFGPITTICNIASNSGSFNIWDMNYENITKRYSELNPTSRSNDLWVMWNVDLSAVSTAPEKCPLTFLQAQLKKKKKVIFTLFAALIAYVFW